MESKFQIWQVCSSTILPLSHLKCGLQSIRLICYAYQHFILSKIFIVYLQNSLWVRKCVMIRLNFLFIDRIVSEVDIILNISKADLCYYIVVGVVLVPAIKNLRQQCSCS